MSSIDQDIERRIAQQVAAWQRGVRSRGAPLEIDSAWLQTPPGLRLPFQVLKSAGIPPREVELLAERAHLRERLEQCQENVEREGLRQRLGELEQHLAFRLEALARLGKT
ncbi:DUF1992 domain-containing protein [Pseudomonadota bacterium DY0742]|uniref:DUF1992 domain-containing protein n=1 Tax=Stutzerimonas balearica TaxID=74829 RepID=UPI001BCA3087|nr:DUF1992 domain-containing protein [Stutzerimonas balearica]MBS4148632.1 DUF1992 domain-containing protein [Stutzerimonas balearica]